MTLELRRDRSRAALIRLRHGEATTLALTSARSRGRSLAYRVVATGSGRITPGRIARATLTLADRPCTTS